MLLVMSFETVGFCWKYLPLELAPAYFHLQSLWSTTFFSS